jgi:membrane-associated phospholipid phosphatase
MEAIWQWGINLIMAIQQVHGPGPDSIFRGITFLGEEQFYLLLLPLILWCFDYSFGAVLAVFFLLSNSLNVLLKDLLQQPRPFNLNPALRLSQATGYGLPSGHAQLSVTVWGAIADRVRRLWCWALTLMLMLLIGFSRVYLGVHFPTDVLAGWFIAAIMLAFYIRFSPRIGKWLAGLHLGLQLLLAAGLPLLLLVPDPAVEGLTNSGTLFGVGVGLVFARRYVSFSARGRWWKRLVRFLVGIMGLLVLYLELKAVFPPDGSVAGAIGRFLRYALVGGWVVIGAPWLFRLMRLAEVRPSTES